MYDDLADLYDLFVDWPTRLKTELPLLKRLGIGYSGQRIADVACGTGHHARALAERGCDAVAFDASAEMIARAQADDQGGTVHWRVGSFADVPTDIKADALICLGTSLPHVASRDEYRVALGAFAHAVKPGGIIVIHSRNLPRSLTKAERFLPPLPRRSGSGMVLFWRFYDLLPPEYLDFNLVILREQNGGWTHDVLTSRLCVVSADDLATMATDAGMSDVSVYGHLDGRPYDLETSPDLVLIGIR